VFKEVLKEAELENELRPVLTRWKNERTPGERFGDFAARVLWPELAEAPAPAGAEIADGR
jgi:sulfite reductase (NADPH) hemoprotein beta-component